jgi:uncharacterized protein YkwD
VVKWLALLTAAAAALVPAEAGADPAPAPPVCISTVPGLPISCPAPAPQPRQPPQQTSHVASIETATSPAPTAVSAIPTLATAVLTEVNKARRAHGLRALVLSARLSRAATEHVRALATAGMFTHNWPTDGRSFGNWIRSFYPATGYRTWSVGENLIWASPGFAANDAVKQWLDSPMHRRVMLTRSWRELGIGVVSALVAPGAFGGRDVQIAAADFGVRSR